MIVPGLAANNDDNNANNDDENNNIIKPSLEPRQGEKEKKEEETATNANYNNRPSSSNSQHDSKDSQSIGICKNLNKNDVQKQVPKASSWKQCLCCMGRYSNGGDSDIFFTVSHDNGQTFDSCY